MNIWKEGKYIDLWSVNHFLSGIVFTGWILFFTKSIWIILPLYLLIAIAWELFEVFKKVQEHIGNKIFDVLTGVLGVILMLMLQSKIDIIGLVILTLIYTSLELKGYFAYKASSNGRRADIMENMLAIKKRRSGRGIY